LSFMTFKRSSSHTYYLLLFNVISLLLRKPIRDTEIDNPLLD
jgi:hypothetical protein